MKIKVLMIASALVVAGCNTGGPKQTGGTLIGAAAGGLVGSTIGGGAGRVAAASIGAVGGALLGNQIGKNMDAQDNASAAASSHSHMSHDEMHRRGVPHRH